jgi:predicted double-glycine peptidase
MRVLLLAAWMGCASFAQAQGVHLPAISGGNLHLPLTSLKQTRLAGTVLQEYDFSCGSAALATLLTHHYGYPVTEQAVLQDMYSVGDQEKIQREGFSLLDMKRYLAHIGFEADGFQQPLDKLLEARIPAVALINEGGYHHFVVIKGLDAQRVLLGDPAKGARTVARQDFEATWVGGLLFVIHNHMEMARFNLPADWRAVPRSPLRAGVGREGLAGIDLPKQGPGDF